MQAHDIAKTFPSVCLSKSNAWIVRKRKKLVLGLLHILIPHERAFILASWQEWMVGDDPFYLKFWVKLTLLDQKRNYW